MFDRLKTQFAIPDHRREHICELVNESFEELLATDSLVTRLLGTRLSFFVFVLLQKSSSFAGWFSVRRSRPHDRPDHEPKALSQIPVRSSDSQRGQKKQTSRVLR